MQIEIIADVKINTVPTAKGSYQVAEVAYKDLKDGKVNGKKIMSFGNKDVFKTVSNAKSGEVYTIELEKDDKGYWQWKTMVKGNAAPPQQASANPAPRSTYETPEERSKRQDFIIRQSSLSSAIALLKTEKHTPTTEEVIKVAEEFVGFVYNLPWETTSNTFLGDMSDDIPQ